MAYAHLQILSEAMPLYVDRRAMLGICLSILGCAVSPLTAGIVYLWLASLALRGIREAIEALSILFLLTLLNPALNRLSADDSMLHWSILLLAIGRIYLEVLLAKHESEGLSSAFWALVVYTIFVATLSLMYSFAPQVSVFKVGTFFLGASAIILGFDHTAHLSAYWKSWFFSIAAGLILMSTPTLLEDRLGRALNGTGFQGVLNHPQAFGAYLAPLVAWFTASLALREWRAGYWVYGLTAWGWVCIYLSGSRTGLFAAALSIVTTVAVVVVSGNSDWRQQFVRVLRDGRTAFAVPILLSVLVLIAPKLWSVTVQFVNKDDAKVAVSEELQLENVPRSRLGLIKASVANFNSAPLTGVGFGTTSKPADLIVKRDPIFDLPISASAEKGFLPTASMEETGIFGTALLGLLIWVLARRTFARKSVLGFLILTACLFVNLGEMVFFAFGGLGVHIWLMIGLAEVY